MKKALLVLVGAGLAASAQATVVTFDDLTGAGAVPAGYGGVASWGGWNYYDSDQPPYNAASPFTRIYSGSETRISFGGDVVFAGAYFAGYGNDDGVGAANLEWRMWNNNVLVATSGVIDPSGTPTFLASGYGGAVDEVSVGLVNDGGLGYGYFVVDNFTYDIPAPSSALALSVLGLAGLRRRR